MGRGRGSERESQPGSRDQQKDSAGNLQISGLLIQWKLPEGAVELELDAKGNQPPPRGSSLEGQGGGAWSAARFLPN